MFTYLLCSNMYFIITVVKLNHLAPNFLLIRNKGIYLSILFLVLIWINSIFSDM